MVSRDFTFVTRFLTFVTTVGVNSSLFCCEQTPDVKLFVNPHNQRFQNHTTVVSNIYNGGFILHIAVSSTRVESFRLNMKPLIMRVDEKFYIGGLFTAKEGTVHTGRCDKCKNPCYKCKNSRNRPNSPSPLGDIPLLPRKSTILTTPCSRPRGATAVCSPL